MAARRSKGGPGPALDKFTVTPADGGGFLIHLESEDGDSVEMTATRAQLDVMADALDDILADTEEDDAAEDEDEEEQ